MNQNELAGQDEVFSSLLTACDEALAEGSPPTVLNGDSLAPTLRARLERGVACMHL